MFPALHGFACRQKRGAPLAPRRNSLTLTQEWRRAHGAFNAFDKVIRYRHAFLDRGHLGVLARARLRGSLTPRRAGNIVASGRR
jgi:hypothetical protein